MNENKTEQNKLNELRERLEELSFKENEVTDDVPKVLECLFVPTAFLILALVILVVVKCITH